MHWAAFNGHIEVVESLVKLGADVNSLTAVSIVIHISMWATVLLYFLISCVYLIGELYAHVSCYA